LERVLGANDLMGVAFLERGLQVARTVGRVWVGVVNGRPSGFGTGFLVSPRLFLTNHHVLGDPRVAGQSLVEFDYQLGVGGAFLASAIFAVAPQELHLADKPLDYALVALEPVSRDGRELAGFGFNTLIQEEGKAIAAQWVNIIQHPSGEPKQLALRENQLIDVLEEFLHYRTDTAPGSSGAPLFNDQWEVIGLHHSGVWEKNAAGQILAVDGKPWRPEMGEHRIKWIANEGARISRVVAHLRRQPMNAAQRALFDQAFTAPNESTVPPLASRPPLAGGPPAGALPVGGPDGAVTWTFPVSLTIRVGCAGLPAAQPALAPATVASPMPAAATPDRNEPPDGDDESVLAAARRQWQGREDVLGVRLGYVFENGWITKRRALVVSVPRRRSLAELRESGVPPLPETFGGLPVEVVNPTLSELLRLARGPAAVEALVGLQDVRPEEITYFPPEDDSLPAFAETMRVVAHVSPDAGWTELAKFLKGVKKRLVVGMYDFGAPHIFEAVKAAGSKAAFDELLLVMQKGENVGTGTKKDDLRDTEVVEGFAAALGEKFANAWVKKGPVNGWIASSYHIKVAVRDRTALWLSSGNWQSSNQPDADPLADPTDRSWLDRYNRDWHAIVEHAGLAKLYERFLRHDFDNNQGTSPTEDFALPDVFVPQLLVDERRLERRREFKYFAPFVAERKFSVQPLLTPDNYHRHVLELVERAEEELLIQNQTFKAPKPGHDKLKELVDAVLAKQRSGVRVRIIFRVLFEPDAREALDGLQEYGFEMQDVRVQPNCHTKAIIVDRKRVVISSQNWSNDGVSVNRDAGLLFDDEPLAKYFADIFWHDWRNLADQNIGREVQPTEIAPANAPTPEGQVRLDWKDYLEML
jgi:V8-like Glu-specific endopeptidase